MGNGFSFEVLRTSGAARLGRLVTAHSVVDTPVFMPVGTLAAIKGLDTDDIAQLGAKIMLSNAYHLALRPGADVVREMGGLHAFMGNHQGSILTDSGGFQVFSLAHARRIDDDGVRFRSHIDGRLLHLTPESLVALQEDLGPDIAMVLDECPPGQASLEVAERAVARTTLWAKRALAARRSDALSWFGIVQGATHLDLRRRHAETMSALPFDGMAIGGVSVGESADDIAKVVAATAPLLPAHKPRYLMGVGTPGDLIRGVASGVDMFDCVMPSRNARNGTLFVSANADGHKAGKLNIKGAAHRLADQPIDPRCGCLVCARYSRAYMRHLFVAKELSFYRLATLHNVAYYLALMARIRSALAAGTFVAREFLAEIGESLDTGELVHTLG